MLFPSLIFLFGYLPVALAGFLLLERLERKWSLLWLAGASLVFYGWWNPSHVALLLFSIAVNYYLGLGLQGSRHRRLLLIVAVGFNVTSLIVFKYSAFAISNLNELIGLGLPVIALHLPLAISFFTFQKIAYLVDVSKGKVRNHSVLDYLAFVTFFPQLIAGPITRFEEMQPDLRRERSAFQKWQDIAMGLALISIGLAKKVLLADRLARIVDPTFALAAASTPISSFDAWVGAVAYALQLYFDFSGYADMAIGLGRLFGFTLPINFDSPYKATGIVDFWRRWHMTLSRFLRDYLYIPLGGNRRGIWRRDANLLIVFLVAGFWHGAAWTFVIWGLVHGLLLIVNHHYLDWYRGVAGLHRIPAAVQRGFARTFTFLLLVCTWVIFRAGTVETATEFFRSMFGLKSGAASTVTLGSTAAVLVLTFVVWWAPNAYEYLNGCFGPDARAKHGERQGTQTWWQWRPTLVHAVPLGVLSCISLAAIALSQSRIFLYFQF